MNQHENGDQDLDSTDVESCPRVDPHAAHRPGDTIDFDRPSTARMYDYYLGGSANFAVDREAAEQALAIAPDGGSYVRANRSFLRRAVAYLCDCGIDQFLDLGSGIPTVGNVHHAAHEYNPAAKVAYIDLDPVAVHHARHLLGDDPLATVTEADLRTPDDVLTGASELLDFDRPVAVLAISVMPFVADPDAPADIVAAYRDACAPGSYLALSHGSPMTLTDDQVRRTQAIYERAGTTLTWRPRHDIEPMFAGYCLVDPGLVLIGQWRPDPSDPTPPEVTNGYAGLGYLS